MSKAAITVLRSRDEVHRLWHEMHPDYEQAEISFADAPGDRGTEILARIETPGLVGQAVGKVTGSDPVAKTKDDLRRFKQLLEAGEISRSPGAPEGETLESKLGQSNAQPEEAGV